MGSEMCIRDRLWVEANVIFGNASRDIVFEFDMLDNGSANLTYRGVGVENLRPQLEDLNDVSPDTEQ